MVDYSRVYALGRENGSMWDDRGQYNLENKIDLEPYEV